MKINYKSGFIERISKEYLNLTLLDENNKVVYKATIDNLKASIIINKGKNITLKPC
jgi:hypothetical protein